MNFEFQPKLTKELILSRVTQEQILGYYLGASVLNKHGLFRSELRADKNPTCSLYKNKKGVLIYKDFATNQHLDCFSYVMEKFGCDFWTALKIIANDFDIIKYDNLPKNKGDIVSSSVKIEEKELTEIGVKVQDFTDLELKWWEKYGITKDILEAYNVFSCQYVWINGTLSAESKQHCPIFGYYGKKYHGMELWRLYFPKRKDSRFMGNWPSKKLQGLDQLPKKGKILVITKSMKDCMALYALGIPAIAPCSEVIIPSKNIIDKLSERFNHIFVLWDNDYTGVTFLNKIKREYSNLNCLIIPRKYGAKDFSDLRAKYGEKETKKLIIQYLKWFKKEKLTTK